MLSKRKLFWGLVLLSAGSSLFWAIYYYGFTSKAFFGFCLGFAISSVVVIPSAFLFVVFGEWKKKHLGDDYSGE